MHTKLLKGRILANIKLKQIHPKSFKTLSLSPKSQEKLNAVRFVFDEVRASKSKDIDTDFTQSKHATRFKEYENLLAWCDLFLRKKSLTPYSGSDLAYALLFPMEKLFESFVGFWLQRSLGDRYAVSLQEQKYSLIKDNSYKKLRPDIVVRSKEATQEELVILDTKWKIAQKLEGVSQDDLYQIGAYASTYATLEQTHTSACLVYPWQDGAQPSTGAFEACPSTGQSIQLRIVYFPL